jgi:hypothetical protein
MVIDYFRGYAHARSLDIAVQIKIMGAFVGIYRSMVCYLYLAAFRRVQDCVLKEKRI